MTFRLPPKALSGSIIILISLMLVAIPIQTNLIAQDAATACMDAERQAQSDISGGTWFALGCLFGIIVYLIALQEPNPPATQLLGKSPEYVAAYTDCYRKKGKQIKSKNALTGCLIGTAASVVFYVILLSSVNSSVE